MKPLHCKGFSVFVTHTAGKKGFMALC